MKLSELHYVVNHSYQPNVDPEVVVLIKLPYTTLGSRPCVPIQSAHLGFDWDAGKFLLQPQEALCPCDRDFEKTMKDLEGQISNLTSENRILKRQIKQLSENSEN